MGETIARHAHAVRHYFLVWMVWGGRMHGYLPTLYLPQITTKSHEIKCVGRGMKGSIDPAPRAGGAAMPLSRGQLG